MSAPSVPTSARVERVGRGALVALLILPAGVAAWLLVWSLGYVASIVAALVSVGAFWLYTRGAGGISRVGALVVLGITVVTLLIAFFAGIVLDVAKAYGDVTGLGAWGAFTHEAFWPSFWQDFPAVFAEERGDLLWAVGFGALGSFATLRTAFAAAKGVPAAAPTADLPPEGVIPAAAPEGGAPAVAYEAAAPVAPAIAEPVAAEPVAVEPVPAEAPAGDPAVEEPPAR